jgi:uncharacterized membrane protein YwzB
MEESQHTRNKVDFVVIIHVSCVKIITNYWSSQPIIRTNYAKSVGMPQDKFLVIPVTLHVNNNTQVPTDQPCHDPVYKIRLILDHLNLKFKNVYTVEKQQLMKL